MLGFLPRMPLIERTGAAPGPVLVRELRPTSVESALPLALATIDSAETFEAISTPAGDLVANGRIAKFLIDRRNPAVPVVRFVNGNFTDGSGAVPDEAKFHFFFGRAVFNVPEPLGVFNSVTYFVQDKRYVAGSVHSYLLDGRTEPIYAVQFYPQDVAREQTVLEAVGIVAEQITIPGAQLAFVPTGTQQTVAEVADDLASLNVEVVPLDRILGSIVYLPLNVGEAWGHLRIFPTDHDELRPTDIPVFDELPLDLSVVAGTMTRAVQDTNSHVNLKSKERGTPNAVLRDAGPDHPRLAPFADQPVHLVVGRDDFSIESTTEEVVAQKLAEKLDRPLVALEWQPETELRSYAEMAGGSRSETLAFSTRYGGKAANLGFLTHRAVLGTVDDPGSPSADRGYNLVPAGFGVPLQAYADFVAHPPNSDIRALIDKLVSDVQGGQLSPKELATRSEEVQHAFLAGSFPPGALEAIRAKLDEVLPGVEKIKVRSSANAEDIPNFDGAGLHDSFAADTDKRDRPIGSCLVEEDDEEEGGEVKRKVKPKSVGCAVKGVYASLWNKRAIEERFFARIDQTDIAMGLAIVPAYDLESEIVANTVVVTRVLNTDDVFGYSLSVQEGNNLVTNPDPGTHSEVTIAAFLGDDEPTSLTVTRFAKPTRDAPERTEPVLSSERMLELVEVAKAVEEAYCQAKPGYYPNCRVVTSANDKEAALDLEAKILANGHLVYKQVREFGGR
jgi:pyruvate, water dikinase